MQGINLARRPFVNRRPVLRLAILLWIAGVGLTIHNVRQFTDHWQGTKVNRQRLADVDQQVREERKKLAELDREMARTSLRRENRHTSFLNRLIAYRTFPWSGLFDDLEEVVPRDVKLLSVRPEVQLKTEPKTAKRRRQGRRSRPASAQTEVEAGDSPDSGQATSSDDEQPLRRDEVRLQLNGVAKTEDAVVEFIEVLYASPSFRSPFLPGETFDVGGKVKFTLSTIYLTGRGAVPEAVGAEPIEAEALAAERSEAGGSGAQQVGTETAEIEAEALEADGDPSQRPGATRGAVARDSTQSAPRRGQPAEPRSRKARPRKLRGARSGAAQPGEAQPGEAQPGEARPGAVRPGTATGLPGAGASGSAAAPGSSAPGAAGASSLPAPGQPTFAQPAASATPELRRGTLIGPGAAWRQDVVPAFDPWEARA